MKVYQAVLHPIAIAIGVAVLGGAGVYSTIARPGSEPVIHAVNMITVAAADRAGATVSPTR